jgi:hypothetical protein
VLDSKLTKIKDLIEQKHKIDEELAVLLGEKERPRRGRPPKPNGADQAVTGASE